MNDIAPSLASRAVALAGEGAARLDRWLALHERELAAAESAGEPPPLKDLLDLLAAAKRLLEIARLATNAAPTESDRDRDAKLDDEALRALLRAED